MEETKDDQQREPITPGPWRAPSLATSYSQKTSGTSKGAGHRSRILALSTVHALDRSRGPVRRRNHSMPNSEELPAMWPGKTTTLLLIVLSLPGDATCRAPHGSSHPTASRAAGHPRHLVLQPGCLASGRRGRFEMPHCATQLCGTRGDDWPRGVRPAIDSSHSPPEGETVLLAGRGRSRSKTVGRARKRQKDSTEDYDVFFSPGMSLRAFPSSRLLPDEASCMQ